MWQKFRIYVEKIVPEKLFKKTWVPEACRWTPKQGKPVKKYVGVPVISEFLDKNGAKRLIRKEVEETVCGNLF